MQLNSQNRLKPRTQNILAGAVLIGLLAWSAARRGPSSNGTGQSCGTCYPFLPSLDALRLTSVTNGTITNSSLRMLSATNLTPSPKQP
jgi:hypothetical protein